MNMKMILHMKTISNVKMTKRTSNKPNQTKTAKSKPPNQTYQTKLAYQTKPIIPNPLK